ncbi:MBL fold metallo-hydrolase [Leucothrix arctica]|uniref:MBL fold metallo-hydrolase n=1 Tax=Leucothrix arctica TaxID=1481894 RepID=A0A317C4W6_9GAMM|nr:MBL fold metallo-hydrolase [Leucothrix arctica]PWQ93726.1 MBL fold metallo-hydrolase [Leucothrix arctica]
MTRQTVLKPEVFEFLEPSSCTFSYIVKDPTSNKCAVVDSVLDFDYPSGTVSYQSANKIIAAIREKELDVVWLLETHVHADHLSAAPYIQDAVGGKIAISKHITTVQEVFGKLFNEGTEFQRTGEQFDKLLDDDETYTVGALQGQALYTPGHTPACVAHVIGDAAFVGDTMFMPDIGTARTDFPGGDARTLYHSIQRVLSLPEDTRLFLCHDYPPEGRGFTFESSVHDQKMSNIHVKDGISEDDFVVMREARDKESGMPRLIFPSLQVNMRAGHFPEPATEDAVYLKVPVSGLKK